MKRALSALLLMALLTSLAMPAGAARKKRKPISESWTATVPPAPINDSSLGGCAANGVADVTYSSRSLDAPWNGQLEVSLENFEGDWDIWVVDQEDGSVRGKAGTYRFGAESLQLKLRKGDSVDIRACNAIGSPTADVSFTFSAERSA